MWVAVATPLGIWEWLEHPHLATPHGRMGVALRSPKEIKAIGKISSPTAIIGLFLHSRALISMLFLDFVGELELARGLLSISFANIIGYSVISGLAIRMEPICGQAYDAKQWKLLGLTLQRTMVHQALEEIKAKGMAMATRFFKKKLKSNYLFLLWTISLWYFSHMNNQLWHLTLSNYHLITFSPISLVKMVKIKGQRLYDLHMLF